MISPVLKSKKHVAKQHTAALFCKLIGDTHLEGFSSPALFLQILSCFLLVNKKKTRGPAETEWTG